MRIGTVIASGALAVGGFFAFAVPAIAAPGVCTEPPGALVSQNAKLPGPNAGPNSAVQWQVREGAPNTPGQQNVNLCVQPEVTTLPPLPPLAP